MLTQEKMLVVLRDGKKIIGVLRSFDQYGLKTHEISTDISKSCTAGCC